MKKKTVSILLTAAMALSLAACGSSNSTDSSSKSSSKAESTSASSASSEAESASSAESTADGEVFDDTTVTVFAAKSLNSVMETLISEYNKNQPNVKLVGSYDSSGTLMTQIEEGASCDVFFSAAAKQMDQLEGENLLVEGTRHNIVNNQVCAEAIASAEETDLLENPIEGALGVKENEIELTIKPYEIRTIRIRTAK